MRWEKSPTWEWGEGSKSLGGGIPQTQAGGSEAHQLKTMMSGLQTPTFHFHTTA